MSFKQYLKVVIFFIILMDLTKFLLKFCVDEVFEEQGFNDVRRIKRGKSSSLGMPRKASPLSSSFIGNFTWSYIFIHHMICVLLVASFFVLPAV